MVIASDATESGCRETSLLEGQAFTFGFLAFWHAKTQKCEVLSYIAQSDMSPASASLKATPADSSPPFASTFASNSLARRLSAEAFWRF